MMFPFVFLFLYPPTHLSYHGPLKAVTILHIQAEADYAGWQPLKSRGQDTLRCVREPGKGEGGETFQTTM